jgi:DNA-binding response OmpR family regulator
MHTGHHVSFDAFQMDLTSYQVWRDGKPVRLQPKAARILAMLVQRAGRVGALRSFQYQHLGRRRAPG